MQGLFFSGPAHQQHVALAIKASKARLSEGHRRPTAGRDCQPRHSGCNPVAAVPIRARYHRRRGRKRPWRGVFCFLLASLRGHEPPNQKKEGPRLGRPTKNAKLNENISRKVIEPFLLYYSRPASVRQSWPPSLLTLCCRRNCRLFRCFAGFHYGRSKARRPAEKLPSSRDSS